MVHAVRIKDGVAAYCNSYVDTRKLALEKKAGRPIWAKVGGRQWGLGYAYGLSHDSQNSSALFLYRYNSQGALLQWPRCAGGERTSFCRRLIPELFPRHAKAKACRGVCLLAGAGHVCMCVHVQHTLMRQQPLPLPQTCYAATKPSR